MKKKSLIFILALVLLCSCRQQTEETAGNTPSSEIVQSETEPKDTLPIVVPGTEQEVTGEIKSTNRFGEYVFDDGNYYFRQYQKEDYMQTAIDTSHGYVADRKRNMMCYTAQGELKELFFDDGVGSFYVFQHQFFGMTKEALDGEIYTVDMKGENRRVIEQGRILAADDDTGFLICQNKDLGIFSVNLNTEKYVITPLTIKGIFLAVQDGIVYYQQNPEGKEASLGKAVLKCVSVDGTAEQVVAETKADLYTAPQGDGTTLIRDFYITPYNFYFSYGRLAGTAQRYQGGGIMCVPRDGIGARRLTTELVGEHFFVMESGIADYLYFYSSQEPCFRCKNLTTEEITETDIRSSAVNEPYLHEGALYYLNADTGKIETVFSKEEVDSLDAWMSDYLDCESDMYTFENTVFSERYVFTQMCYYVRVPEEDIGWRTAYGYIGQAVFVKDCTTGEIKVLHSFK